ncbi:MAG: hypothetical protein P4L54_06945 [Acidocella sp.]|nr:hypothetical protein [Acidocella sp.]
MPVAIHKYYSTWKTQVFAVIMIAITSQAEMPAAVAMHHQRKSASLMVGATVLPYAGKQGKIPQRTAVYISRVPGERYY